MTRPYYSSIVRLSRDQFAADWRAARASGGAEGERLASTPPGPTATIGRDMTGMSQAPGLILTAPAAAARRTAMAVRTAPA
jgi:hypothetical protein